MKAGVPTPNYNIHDPSGLIKQELAKYRMLKSKGAILTNEGIEENKLLFRSTTPQDPSPEELSSRTAALQWSSPRMASRNNSTLRSENSMFSLAKGYSVPTQSYNSGPSVLTTGESFRGPTSHRDRNASGDYYSSQVTKRAKNSHNIPANPSSRQALRLSSRTPEKKLGSRKSLASEERTKQKLMSRIEQFVDSDLDKDILDKIYPKTGQHSLRNSQPSIKGELKRLNKVPSNGESRAASAMEINKYGRESKNFTPEHERRKKSMPLSPKKVITTSLRNSKPERKSESSSLRIISPQRMRVKTDDGDRIEILQEEIDKWRIFGKMMSESYDDLNRKYTNYMSQKEKDKQIISELKDQVNSLKILLKEVKDENMKYKEASSKSASEKGETTLLVKEMEHIKNQNKEVIKTMEFLKIENESLKSTLEESQKYEELAQYYQNLSETRFKECSALAEEIICLRTDLDRSHSNYLRIQREQGLAKTTEIQKLSRNNSSQIGAWEEESSLRGYGSAKKLKRQTEKRTENLSEEDDDQPPVPADFNTVPSKENISIIG